jgi:DNA topoisomerase-3
VPKDKKAIETNIYREARNADMLMIWTDCDREGEAIGAEIAQIARRSNRTIIVKRARFSAIIAQCVPRLSHLRRLCDFLQRQIHHAAQNPVNLDQAQADAVEARSILDLRIGAAFTRLQTLRLQDRLSDVTKEVISYGQLVHPLAFRSALNRMIGTCQFPTLGFVVARHLDVQSFRPEQFWYIHLILSQPSPQGTTNTEFMWKRGHLFSFDEAAVLYEHVLSDVQATVSNVTTKETKKW